MCISQPTCFSIMADKRIYRYLARLRAHLRYPTPILLLSILLNCVYCIITNVQTFDQALSIMHMQYMVTRSRNECAIIFARRKSHFMRRYF